MNLFVNIETKIQVKQNLHNKRRLDMNIKYINQFIMN